MTPWSADEINDLELSWADFSVAHPGRTYDAWRVKRAAHRKTLLASPYREPEAKVAPIVETLLQARINEVYMAIQIVERAGCSPELTAAVTMLGAQLDIHRAHLKALLEQEEQRIIALFGVGSNE